MSVRAAIVLIGIVLSPCATAECPALKLSEEYNAFRLWVGLITKAQYEIPVCETFRIDVSDYIEGGSALDGRPPSNFLYVQITEGDNRFEITRDIKSGDKVVELDFSSGRLIAGAAAPSKLVPGQSVIFGIGVKDPMNFDSYILAGGVVKSDG